MMQSNSILRGPRDQAPSSPPRARLAAPFTSAPRLVLAWGVGLTAACGAGAYGHSRLYAPLAEESRAAQGASGYDPVMAQRMPDQWVGTRVSLFGVVTQQTAPHRYTLSVRQPSARNLCEQNGEETCRVTVSDHETALVHAELEPAAGTQDAGNEIRPGSLMRVIGALQAAAEGGDGLDTVIADYYRHWPSGEYVTDAARAYMRR